MCSVSTVFRGATLIAAFLTIPLGAQEAGSIQGRVVDPQGATVPNVKVTLEQEGTGNTRSAIAGSDGLYSFAIVPVGIYTITAEAPGFKRAIVPSVRVEVAQRVQMDFALEIGAVTETVQVTSSAPQLQTADSQIGAVVETKAITDLPLNGRNFTQLMVLMAGSTERSGGTVAGHYGERAAGTAFSVNGQRQTANQFLINGFMAKEVQHGTNSVEPIIDALQEFRVQSTNYSAEFGTEAGGQINAVMKSGTNQFHGTAWEFLRNDRLDANNFFNNRTGTERPAFRRNQFGVSGGAPLLLPKYDGRNRTFLFGAYEGTRVRKGITQLTTVPSAELRSGNLSSLPTVRDPLTGQPFPNNTIPSNRINPIMAAILERYVPLPNRTGVFNWISTDPQRIDVEQYNWRIDHRFSETDSIFGHYIFEDTDFRYPKLFPTDGASQKFRGQNALISWTHLMGANSVNDFRVGFSRFIQNEFQARAGRVNVVRELGMEGLCEIPSCWGIPQMNVTGFASFGEHGGQSVSGPRAWRNEAYQWQDSFYHTRGSHSIKFGVIVRRHRDNFPEAIYPRGAYSFNGFLTGQPFGDFLLGYPRNTQTSIDVFSPHFRYTVAEPWFQDDWRVTPELTLNLGLRYEWAGRPLSKDNSISTVIFDESGARLITARDPQGYPSALAYDDFNNFAPRIGFAWTPKFLGSKTVFRGAYGIFYQRELANTWVDLAINDPFIRQTNINLETDASSPYHFARYDLSRPTALAPPTPLLTFSVDTDWKDGQVHQWNFNIQQSLGFDTVLQVAYVGNRGLRLPWATLPNQAAPGPGPIQPRRPYPDFGVVNGLGSRGDSNYHGLQIQGEKRYSKGLLFMAGYTFAKCISNSDSTFVGEGTSIQNGRDFSQQRGLCTQHFSHRYTLSWLYDLPFGRGKAFLGNAPRPVEAILGNWQINGILTLRSGSPFTVGQPGDAPNTGEGSPRPDQVGDANDIEERTVDRFFNTDAFAQADAFRWGTAGRNTVIGPGINNWDFSVFKSFAIDEARRIQFRAEFFNLFNHAEFGFPGASFGTAQFGRISGTSRDPRDIQLSLKFLW
ncbi:MAG TPA: carboxypeptidase regulatory-like domain-containing protein [Bryobacteraceae bacterium]|nr:carboxypeptidase regulatory-like domain-containing protein [Bryobacteraceae bacterium]